MIWVYIGVTMAIAAVHEYLQAKDIAARIKEQADKRQRDWKRAASTTGLDKDVYLRM